MSSLSRCAKVVNVQVAVRQVKQGIEAFLGSEPAQSSLHPSQYVHLYLSKQTVCQRVSERGARA